MRKSQGHNEYHRKFFRQVDNTLKSFLRDDPLPLVVVGDNRFLAFFREVSAHNASMVAEIQGSHVKTITHDQGKLLWLHIKARLADLRQGSFIELDKAVSERKTVSSVGEVWHRAQHSRGRLLLVEEDFYFSARVDESGQHLTPADDPTAPDVIDDAVDEIIEQVLRTEGQVVFVENGRLDAHQRIALILRY